jgi:hypothetical protein
MRIKEPLIKKIRHSRNPETIAASDFAERAFNPDCPLGIFCGIEAN